MSNALSLAGRRTAIWLVHTGTMHDRIAPLLAADRVDVTYVCASARRLGAIEGLIPSCLRHSTADAIAARMPGGAPAAQPDAAVLAALRPIEATALLMMDRLNYTRLPARAVFGRYVQYVGMWLALIEKRRPAAVVFQSTPHMGYDYVLYALCRHSGIPTLIVERTYLPDRLLLLDRFDELPAPPASLFATPEDQASGSEEPANYYDARNRAFAKAVGSGARGRTAGKMAEGLRLSASQTLGSRGKLLAPFESSAFGLLPRRPTHAWYQWRVLCDGFTRAAWRRRYERAALPPDMSRPFVFFPLQFQPERTSLPMGGRFADQLFAIETLIETLPAGWQLYVKEHPRQFSDDPVRTSLGRTREFYDRLIAFPRDKVRLLPLDTASGDLIASSRMVATTAGTAGWEAVRAGVPALVLGTPWYVNCPGVMRASSTDDCARAMARCREGLAVDTAMVQRFERWVRDEASFAGYFGDVFEAASSVSRDETTRNYAAAIAAAVHAPVQAARAGGSRLEAS